LHNIYGQYVKEKLRIWLKTRVVWSCCSSCSSTMKFVCMREKNA